MFHGCKGKVAKLWKNSNSLSTAKDKDCIELSQNVHNPIISTIMVIISVTPMSLGIIIFIVRLHVYRQGGITNE